ncbi:MAG: phosphate-starvation-inducible PsiE family protein [Negativicutes bacterium]|nr:phosphate-starvation-inducible PsiE family protein [Negativicutes bacterium]
MLEYNKGPAQLATKACDTEFECKVADYLRRFTRWLHVFFSIALATTVIMSLFVFFNDVAHAYISGNVGSGTIHALGSLLILWTLSELLNSEIRHLRGEKIKVTIFIEVAVAALVRKLLVISTEGASLTDSSVYLASLLVLGIVYWLLQTKQTT